MQEHLHKVFDWIEKLNQLNTDGVSASLHDKPQIGSLRPDIIEK